MPEKSVLLPKLQWCLQFNLESDAGCFKKFNVEVKYNTVVTSQIGMAGLVGGTYDVVVNTPTNLLLAMANGGFDGKVIAPRHGYSYEELVRAKLSPYYPGKLLLQTALIVGSKSEINSWSDLAGKKIGLQSIQSADHAGTLLAVSAAGGNTKKIEFLSMPSSQMESALAKGDVDAVIPNDPFASQIINIDGGRIIGYPNAYFADPGVAVAYVSSGEIVKKKRKLLIEFQKAILESNKLINIEENQPYFRQLTSSLTGVSAEAAAKIRIPEFITSKVEADEIDATQRKLVKVGFLAKAFNSNKLVNW
jgi:ABC-type amino acid transport substrate-binding protein